MSKEAFDAFRNKLAEDQTLHQEMKRVLGEDGAKETTTVEELVAFAKTRGYDVSPEDVRPSTELDDTQLDAVAGGAVDVFLKLGDVTGEARSASQNKEILIESFGWYRG